MWAWLEWREQQKSRRRRPGDWNQSEGFTGTRILSPVLGTFLLASKYPYYAPLISQRIHRHGHFFWLRGKGLWFLQEHSTHWEPGTVLIALYVNHIQSS